jgi:hypothetical protein
VVIQRVAQWCSFPQRIYKSIQGTGALAVAASEANAELHAQQAINL